METKYVILCILGLFVIVAITGLVLSTTGQSTGAFPLVKVKGRARPGDWDYGAKKPYSPQQNMPIQNNPINQY